LIPPAIEIFLFASAPSLACTARIITCKVLAAVTTATATGTAAAATAQQQLINAQSQLCN